MGESESLLADSHCKYQQDSHPHPHTPMYIPISKLIVGLQSQLLLLLILLLILFVACEHTVCLSMFVRSVLLSN